MSLPWRESAMQVIALAVLAGCSVGTAAPESAEVLHASAASTPRPRLTVELLGLDLATCGRCTGTDRNMEQAMSVIASAMQKAEVDVEVRRVVVSSADQARALRFKSSPTLRVNGRDIPVEFRESACGDCAAICKSADGVDCRVWVWRGKEYTEAPTPLIIDAVFRAYSDAWMPVPVDEAPFVLPQNLDRFFAARDRAR